MPILAILFTCKDSSSPQSQVGRPIKPRGSVMGTKGVGYVHKEGRLWETRGSIPGIQGGSSPTIIGWDHEVAHVGL